MEKYTLVRLVPKFYVLLSLVGDRQYLLLRDIPKRQTSHFSAMYTTRKNNESRKDMSCIFAANYCTRIACENTNQSHHEAVYRHQSCTNAELQIVFRGY